MNSYSGRDTAQAFQDHHELTGKRRKIAVTTVISAQSV